MTLLDVRKLSKSYAGVHAARDVEFSLASGEMLALIGPNGAGKSTTFGMVGGQLTPDTGSVLLNDIDVTGSAPRQLAALGVGRTFQVAATFSSMTVVENVQVALASHRGLSRDVRSMARRHLRDEARAMLSVVGMLDFADRPSSSLSYGDVKRSELAIALAGDPKLLLMDEPTAGMAHRERIQLMELVTRLARERGIGILFTEHDMDAVFSHADRILVLVRGRIIAQGTPDEVRRDPEVKRVYLGESGTAAAAKAKKALA